MKMTSDSTVCDPMMTTSDLTVCDQQQQPVWPPGFRFHPTDEELILYYLKRKICMKRLKLDIIGETDVYRWDPEDLPGQSKLRTGDRQWFFFSPRDRKYPNGLRSNRATQHGYWKVTGKDRNICCNSRNVGVKKTLVFYKGRAPNGERTDWVMHEYTLDEEELKRCQTIGDYYALYKVFKKSGPGPKNGEQYGAPFKEEEWAEDEFALVTPENPAKQHNVIDSAGSQITTPLAILEPVLQMPPPIIADSTRVLQQVFDEVSHSTLVNTPVKGVTYTGRCIELHQSNQNFAANEFFDFTKPSTPILPFNESPEVTSAPLSNIYNQNTQFSYEDFLEINDLLGPEPTPSNDEKYLENLQVDDLDGLSAFDLFDDLCEVGPTPDQQTYQYMNNLENEMISGLDYQLSAQSSNTYEINSQLWTNDIQSNAFFQPETNVGDVNCPAPGMVCPEGSTNVPTEAATLNKSDQNDDSEQHWFTSALWSFVESIPTTPASASENALVNRAFERMSSFSRVRINATNPNVAATAKKARKSMGFFLFSVLGVIFAILCLLMKGKTVFLL